MAETRKERRLRWLAAGMCGNCGCRPFVPGKRKCQPCINTETKWYVQNKARTMETGTARRAHKLAGGMCGNCGSRPFVKGKKFCQLCLDRNSKSGSKRYANLIAQGKCPAHPDTDAVSGKVQCQKCLDKLCSPEHGIYEGVRRARKHHTPFENVNPAIVIKRDRRAYQHCHKECKDDAAADHIIPISKGGPHTYWNHQCLCKSCNSRKHNSIYREPRIAHLIHLPMRKLIEAFAKEQGVNLQ